MHVDDTFLSRTSEDCGFDILLHLEGTMTFTDFVDRNGEPSRSLATYPSLFYTFINAATGTSVTSRSPDPEHFTWRSDGSFTVEVTGLVMRLRRSRLRSSGRPGRSVRRHHRRER